MLLLRVKLPLSMGPMDEERPAKPQSETQKVARLRGLVKGSSHMSGRYKNTIFSSKFEGLGRAVFWGI